MNESINDRLQGIAKIVIVALIFVGCILGAASNCYALERRRAVSPQFPAFVYLQLSCFVASAHAADIQAVAFVVEQDVSAGVPVPPELVRALGVYAANAEMLHVMHDDYWCGPPDALQSVSVEQARDLLNSLIEIVAISSSINKGEPPQ